MINGSKPRIINLLSLDRIVLNMICWESASVNELLSLVLIFHLNYQLNVIQFHILRLSKDIYEIHLICAIRRMWEQWREKYEPHLLALHAPCQNIQILWRKRVVDLKKCDLLTNYFESTWKFYSNFIERMSFCFCDKRELYIEIWWAMPTNNNYLKLNKGMLLCNQPKWQTIAVSVCCDR